MFLAGIKTRGRGITAPKSIPLSDQVDPQRLEQLTARLRADEASQIEKDEIARGHIRLAIQVAGRYAGAYPALTDDLVSCALFGIVYGMSIAHKMHDNCITPWLVANMHRHCSRFILTEPNLRIPVTTLKRLEEKGVEVTKATIVPIDDSKDGTCSAVAVEYAEVNEVREQLFRCAQDEMDRQILELREQGYDDPQIAEIFGCSRQTVNLRRNNIERRFYSNEERNVEIRIRPRRHCQYSGIAGASC